MTDKALFSTLFSILNTIDPDDYPEIYSIICDSIDEDDKTVYSDPFGIVQELFDADASKHCRNAFRIFLLMCLRVNCQKETPMPRAI